MRTRRVRTSGSVAAAVISASMVLAIVVPVFCLPFAAYVFTNLFGASPRYLPLPIDLSEADTVFIWAVMGGLLPFLVGARVAWERKGWRMDVLRSELNVLRALAMGHAAARESDAQRTARTFLETRSDRPEERRQPSSLNTRTISRSVAKRSST